MFLIVAATEFEMSPLLEALAEGDYPSRTLVSGVGGVETATRLSRYLACSQEHFTAVINFGIAGAYLRPDGAEMLDICVADTEVMGDLGVCFEGKMEYLDSSLIGNIQFTLDTQLRKRATALLAARGFAVRTGAFISVNSVSGTRSRGDVLADYWQGLCENMEGAAVARVCKEFDLPCLEIRCVSNFVEDRDTTKWKIKEACQKAAHAATLLIKDF